MTTSTDRSTTAAALVVAGAGGVHLPDRDVALPGRVDALAVDGTTTWVLVDGTEIHRIGADGAVAASVTVRGGTATCLHVHRGVLWVGGDDAALWRLRADALEAVDSFAHAPTRPDWYTPWGGPPSIMSMASHGDDLYVSVHVGGILRTADVGATWEPTIDLHVDVHEVAVDPRDGTVWAATGERALAESRDRGVTWRHHTEGLHATYALAVAVTDAGVVVGTSSGHAARDGALYRYDGSGFARITDGLPDPLQGAVGPRGITARGRRVAVVAPGGAVHVSDDGGTTWAAAPVATGATAIAWRPGS